jgi:Flp pilus assembly protein TadG
MIARLRREDGQVLVMTAVFMVALIGLAGIVLDIGSWFRQQRQQQTTVDAAALAGAQALPNDPTNANALASDFASRNGGVAGATITISSKYTPNDAVTVTKTDSASGLISHIFGVPTVQITTKATAIAEVPSSVIGVAPIVVDINHQMLSGPGCPCFNVPTSIPLGKKGVPGAFGMLDLANSGGNTGNSTLGDWITSGYQHYLPLGDYDSDPGAKFSASQIQNALVNRYGDDLLFPVYNALDGTGSNAGYNVIAWVSFHLTKTDANGNSGTLYGWFDRIVWDGIIPSSGPDTQIPDLGVRSVALVD